jgi:uncharacterized membrane protein YhhN
MVSLLGFIPSLVISGLDWYAVARDRKRLEYFSKPGVIVGLLIWVFIIVGWPLGLSFPVQLIGWFVLGLGFSLIGDILLMLPGRRLLPALASFLIAHLMYIRGLEGLWIPRKFLGPVLLLGLLILPVVLRFLLQAWKVLSETGKEGLRLPIALYLLVISVTLFSGFSRMLVWEWQPLSCYLVAGGVFLLFFSDILFAERAFLSEARPTRLSVHVTYHLGQIALITGALSHFLG